MGEEGGRSLCPGRGLQPDIFLFTVYGTQTRDSMICLSTFFWLLSASFPSFLRKKELIGAGYPCPLAMVWCIY